MSCKNWGGLGCECDLCQSQGCPCEQCEGEEE